MKKFLVLLLTTLFLHYSYADLGIGVRAGYIRGVGIGSTTNDLGFEIGAIARVGALGFFIQPELLYSGFSLPFTDENLQLESSLRTHNIELNGIVGIPLFPLLSFSAGPMVSSTVKAVKEQESISLTDNWHLGLQSGLNLKVKRLTLDLRFKYLFNYDTEMSEQVNPKSIVLSVGFFLFKTG